MPVARVRRRLAARFTWVAAGSVWFATVLAGCQATAPPAVPPPGPSQPAVPVAGAAPTSGAPAVERAQEPQGPPSPFDGIRAADESALRRRPMAVMFDNHPRARPQTGLSKAEVVYEILAEGGITRLMAVFLREQPEVVGPVRSARDYFVQIAAESDPFYVHVGSSPQGKALIERLGVVNLDDGRGAGGFFRSADRSSPHNLYISLPKARAWADQRGWDKREPPGSGFRFAERPQFGGKPAKSIRITIPSAFEGYQVEYAYDEGRGLWLRTINGEPHVDEATREQLAARTVIVQTASTRPVPGDTEGRIEVDVVGSGRAQVFAAGQGTAARWRKQSARTPTVYSDPEGNPLEFPAGQIWVQVVPPGAEVEVR